MLMITGGLLTGSREQTSERAETYGNEYVFRYDGRDFDRSMFKELLGEAASRAS
jgi:hypothetical protein